MNKNKRKRSVAEMIAIKRYYANKAGQAPAENSAVNDLSKQAAPPSSVGKVYRGETKYIDPEPKKQRNYVVVRERGHNVTVSKLKTVKRLDENGKNVDPALVEINHARYGLPNRTGVDYERFDKNRMSGKPLDLTDKDVFPEDSERFELSRRDRDKALYHTGVKKRNKTKKKE